DEEAGVVATRGADRGDPVREVVDAVAGEREALVLAHLDEAATTGVDLGPVPGEAGGDLGIVEPHQSAVGLVGEQEPGLLEALPDGGDPVREAACGHAEP